MMFDVSLEAAPDVRSQKCSTPSPQAGYFSGYVSDTFLGGCMCTVQVHLTECKGCTFVEYLLEIIHAFDRDIAILFYKETSWINSVELRALLPSDTLEAPRNTRVRKLRYIALR
jgi:hypothetical protein